MTRTSNLVSLVLAIAVWQVAASVHASEFTELGAAAAQAQLTEHFRGKSVPIRMTTHGWRRMSIYVDDPDGYHLELTALFDSEEVGRREIEKRGLTVQGRL